MRVVVLGAGAIGSAVAFWLAGRGADVVVVERHAVGGAASGKSGGFLALDWCDGTAVEGLARRSFALHAELAAAPGADWGYRAMTTYAGRVGAVGRGRAGPNWVSDEVSIRGRLGDADTTAQVNPAAFTKAMMRAAVERGARLVTGEATGLVRRGEAVAGVRLGADTLEADAVVVAMGPWSVLASRWLPLPPVYGLKGHSIVFDTGAALPADALFLEFAEAAGSMLTPELFARSDGTTYVCGVSSQTPVPVDPSLVRPDDGAIERLKALCRRVSPVLAVAPVLAEQACFRPVTADGLPLIGAVAGAPGAFVATGHGVWGILNAPATGEAVAELVLDGRARRVELGAFDPGR